MVLLGKPCQNYLPALIVSYPSRISQLSFS
jgi:hypothetical protein